MRQGTFDFLGYDILSPFLVTMLKLRKFPFKGGYGGCYLVYPFEVIYPLDIIDL